MPTPLAVVAEGSDLVFLDPGVRENADPGSELGRGDCGGLPVADRVPALSGGVG